MVEVLESSEVEVVAAVGGLFDASGLVAVVVSSDASGLVVVVVSSAVLPLAEMAG